MAVIFDGKLWRDQDTGATGATSEAARKAALGLRNNAGYGLQRSFGPNRANGGFSLTAGSGSSFAPVPSTGWAFGGTAKSGES